MSDDPIVFGPFEGGDLPEELKAIIANLVGGISMNTTGLAHDRTEDEVHPAEEQLNYGPGDYVAVTQDRQVGESIGHAFEIGVVVDPAEHATTFPDWEDRLFKSYLLLNYYASNETDGDLYGWFPRTQLVKFPKDQWEQLLEMVKSGEAGNFAQPPWMTVRYHEVLAQLAQKNPDLMPPVVRCPVCDGYGVVFTVTKTMKESYAMGYNPAESDGTYPWNNSLFKVCDVAGKYTTKTTWVCNSCGEEDTLPEEIGLYGNN